MMIEQLNFDQKSELACFSASAGHELSSVFAVCMNFTYDPMAFAIIMDMNMNENSVYTNMVSGRDPPPLCLPVVLPGWTFECFVNTFYAILI